MEKFTKSLKELLMNMLPKSNLFWGFLLFCCCSVASAHDLSQEKLNRLYYEAGLAEFKKNGSAFAGLEKYAQDSIKKLKFDRSLTPAQRKEKFDLLTETVEHARKSKKYFKTWTLPRINLVNGVNKGDIGTLHYNDDIANVEVLQILGVDTSIVKAAGQWYKLENYPTGNLADGDRLNVVDIYYCSGNYSYTTVSGGSKTVLILERISSQTKEALMEYATEQQK
jgi:hypothetical protein